MSDEHESSFEHSFDVSHISHVSSDDDSPSDATSEENSNLASRAPLAAAVGSYEDFIQAQQLLLQQQQPHRPSAAASPARRALSPSSKGELSLEEERARLRQRKSQQFTQQQHQQEIQEDVPMQGEQVDGTNNTSVSNSSLSRVPISASQSTPMVARSPPGSNWTAQDDALLRASVTAHQGEDWVEIASVFKGDKSAAECFHRWVSVHETANASLRSPAAVTRAAEIAAELNSAAEETTHPAQQQTSASQQILPLDSDSPSSSQQPLPKSSPVIPKLALGTISKEPAARPDTAAPSHSVKFASSVDASQPSSSVSRPVTAHSDGSQTTRSRLSAFNAKLRSARKLQKWWRDLRVCKPSKARLRQLRKQLADRESRARGFAPEGSEVSRLERRLEFEDPQSPRLAGDKKKSLQHLKDRIAARSGAATARLASASPTRQRFTHSTQSSVNRSSDRITSPLSPSRPATAAVRSQQFQRAPDSQNTSIRSSPYASPSKNVPANIIFRPFPAHAAPKLRALLQGFLVQHQLKQKSNADLIQQIRDVRAMIRQVRDERERIRLNLDSDAAANRQEEIQASQYAAFFLKSLEQQVRTLQARLSASLTMQPGQALLPPTSSFASPSHAVAAAAQAQSSPSANISPSRVQFAAIRASPESVTARPATAAPAGANLGLKRSSQRRYLKKKSGVQELQQRPHTAAPSAVSRSMVSFDVADDSTADASGSQTSRAFLKRKSRNPSAHKLDWSRVSSKVDNKIDGYRAPSSMPTTGGGAHNVFDSVTGREWEEKEGQGNPNRPQSHNFARALSPTHASRARQKKDTPSTSAGTGSQTAREPRSTSSSRPRAAFKPSGNASSALPLLPNTDSAAPPLTDRSVRSRSTERLGAKKSRHITLQARKMDLSQVTSRVDYSSPYKASAEYSPDSSIDGEFDYQRSPQRSKQQSRGKNSGNVSRTFDEDDDDEYDGSYHDSLSNVSSMIPRPATAVVSSSSSRSRARQNASRVTPSRDELRRLDEELAREQEELEKEAEAWEKHAIAAVRPIQSSIDGSSSIAHPHDESIDASLNEDASFAAAAAPASAVPPLSLPSRNVVSAHDELINREIADIERSLNEMNEFAEKRGRGNTARSRVSQPQTNQSSSTAEVTNSDSYRDNTADLPVEWKRVIPADAADIPQSLAPNSTGDVTSENASSAGVLRLTLQFDELSAELARLEQELAKGAHK